MQRIFTKKVDKRKKYNTYLIVAGKGVNGGEMGMASLGLIF